jgi:hypothetical protein
MQGFFVKSNVTTGPTNPLVIPASARVHSANKRYKGFLSIPLIRLQVENSGKTDETVIRFDEKATTSFDNSFDAYKVFPSADIPSVSSFLNGIEYSINGIPYPESSTTIPLIINAPANGSYNINANEITDLGNYKIFLSDNLLGTNIDLNQSPVYSFSTVSGTIRDRFSINIATLETAIPENRLSENAFNIFSRDKMINIQTLGDEWDGKQGNIKIFDMGGRVLGTKENMYFEKGDITSIPFNSQNGFYFVEVKSGVLRYVGKVLVN